MEQWQKDYILSRLTEIIRNTNCSKQLFRLLEERHILGSADVEKLEIMLRNEGNFATSSELYRIAETRTNGYENMLWALHETKQSNALSRLVTGYKFEPASGPEAPAERANRALQQIGLALSRPPTAGRLHIPPTRRHDEVDTPNVPNDVTRQVSLPGTGIVAVANSNTEHSNGQQHAGPNHGKIIFEATDANKIDDGAEGTSVYHGTFQGREVAVKRLFDSRREADVEIDMLLKLDEHTNVIRYYGKEIDIERGCIILALEKAKTTLQKWIEDKSCIAPAAITGREILQQTTEGLRYLHSQKVIHRDLKPSNILLKILSEDDVIVKISDFGISRWISQGRKSKTMTSVIGTEGWMPPEVLSAAVARKRKATGDSTPMDVKFTMTTKVDIFSLGCVFHFVLTNGKHPFGDEDHEYHIKRDEKSLDKGTLAVATNINLLNSMTSKSPEERPDCKEILKDPIMWPAEKSLQFLVDASDFVDDVVEIKKAKKLTHEQKAQMKSPLFKMKEECLANLESAYWSEIGDGHANGWFNHTSNTVRLYLERPKGRYKNFSGSVLMLVRLIRNLSTHNVNLEQPVRDELGRTPEKYLEYWLTRFPLLVYHVHTSFESMAGEDKLPKYY